MHPAGGRFMSLKASLVQKSSLAALARYPQFAGDLFLSEVDARFHIKGVKPRLMIQ